MQRSLVRFALALLALSVASTIGAVGPASAQYFGQNKVQYEQFDFRSFETDQFEIYFYPEEQQAVEDAARMAERWYDRHSRTFLREFQKKKPLIFYANSPDFQQTNAVRGQLGQGTGGVTESIKERVIMPLTGSYGETDHVLGHELVHSFQYDIALRKTTRGSRCATCRCGLLKEWPSICRSGGRTHTPRCGCGMRPCAGTCPQFGSSRATSSPTFPTATARHTWPTSAASTATPPSRTSTK